MSDVSEQKSRLQIAVCGEVNSGKTSFIHALLRDSVLPDVPNDVAKPILRVALASAASSPSYRTKEGQVVEIATIDDVPMDGSVVEITIPSANTDFGACDIIEFPALNDRQLTHAEVNPIGACDVHVWMTIGSQAWRLSEKTIVDKIPNRQRETSLLVVSRTDKFRSAADQEKLTERLSSETSGHFAKGAMLGAAPQALADARSDDAAWAEIGGKDAAATLADLIEKARALQAEVAAAPARDAAPALPDALGDAPGFGRSARVRRTKKYWRGRGEPVLANLDGDEAEHTPQQPQDGVETSDTAVASPEPVADVVADVPDTPVAADEAEAVVATGEADAVAVTTTTTEPDHVAPADKAAQAEEQDVAGIEGLVDKIEGLVSLATFDVDAPQEPTLLGGSAERAQAFAVDFAKAAETVLSTPTFDGSESVHVTLKGHQILYGQLDSNGTVLMLVCRSANPGMARSTFTRLMQSQRHLEAA